MGGAAGVVGLSGPGFCGWVRNSGRGCGRALCDLQPRWRPSTNRPPHDTWGIRVALRSTREFRVSEQGQRCGLHPTPLRHVDRVRRADRAPDGCASGTRPPDPVCRRRSRPTWLVLVAATAPRSRTALRRRTRPAPGDPRTPGPAPRLSGDGALAENNAPLVHPSAVACAVSRTQPEVERPGRAPPHSRTIRAHPLCHGQICLLGLLPTPAARLLAHRRPGACKGGQCAAGLVGRPAVLSATRRRFSARRRALSAATLATSSSPTAARCSSA